MPDQKQLVEDRAVEKEARLRAGEDEATQSFNDATAELKALGIRVEVHDMKSTKKLKAR